MYNTLFLYREMGSKTHPPIVSMETNDQSESLPNTCEQSRDDQSCTAVNDRESKSNPEGICLGDNLENSKENITGHGSQEVEASQTSDSVLEAPDSQNENL